MTVEQNAADQRTPHAVSEGAAGQVYQQAEMCCNEKACAAVPTMRVGEGESRREKRQQKQTA